MKHQIRFAIIQFPAYPLKTNLVFYSVEIYCIDVPEMMLTQILPLSISDIHFTNLPYEYKFSCMQFNIYIIFFCSSLALNRRKKNWEKKNSIHKFA
jgi:hypothetical protein